MQKNRNTLTVDSEKKMLVTNASNVNGLTYNTEFVGHFPLWRQFKMILHQLLRFV